MNKRAFITGITGQDGSYLAELLIGKGYEVHGMLRRSSTMTRGRIDHLGLHEANRLHYGDLTDASSLNCLLKCIQPTEIYNLGAQSHVKGSFEIPEYTGDSVGLGTLRLLEAARVNCPDARVYQAGSSEMFGKVLETPQDENTPFYPRSPYGAAKVYAHWVATNYREAWGMHVSNGILFNHESPRRGVNFVTRKITLGAAAIKLGLKKDKLVLGNLSARRDWGYAKEYVEAMWAMLQQPVPSDYVIATGITTRVEDFARHAFACVDLDYLDHIAISPEYFRPTEVDLLQGDASKAYRMLGWESRMKVKDLARLMVGADMEMLKEKGLQYVETLY